ncbi:MAG: Asp-tRNA(Asn)/Glu-tRNA(Gln) amidotransferase subunit GatA [Chitinophagaceae bacterium]|nr:Asp-tRNA(Asn)/Glu-tRNA(Gln) amidotransferase subunit GatA [Oligoflexus sp.]
MSACAIASAVNEGSIKAADVVSSFLQRTEDLHRELNTHVFWDKEAVQNETEKQLDYIEAARRAQKYLPLAGVPIAIKDNIMAEGSIVSCGSKFLQNHRAAFDATVIKQLKQAGAVLMGRTNMDEFGMGSSNENSAFGPVRNPWNRSHVSGGSSGGSAAAVAAGMTTLALGSDTGGSVRQPASFCGVLGLKPSYGAVSRYGLVAYASSFDQIGPIGTNARDLARTFDLLRTHDPLDSTSVDTSAFEKTEIQLERPLKGLTIGIADELLQEGLDEDVKKSFFESLEVYKELGCTIKKITLPNLRHSIPTYYILATAEASSNLARFDGIRFGVRASKPGASLKDLYAQSRSEGFGREVKQRIMLGTYVLSSGYYDAYYAKANRMRELIRRDFAAAFEYGVDLIATPTAPTTAFVLGQKTDNSLSMYLMDIYTIAANLSGIPALSLPIGLDRKGLPIGLQLMGKTHHEGELLRSAYQYEQYKRWTERPKF